MDTTSPRSTSAPNAAAPTMSGPAYAFTHGRWLLNGRFVQRTRWSVNGMLTDRAPARVDSTIDLANGWAVYNNLTLETYRAIVERARQHGKPVVGHPPRAVGGRGAADSGNL